MKKPKECNYLKELKYILLNKEIMRDVILGYEYADLHVLRGLQQCDIVSTEMKKRIKSYLKQVVPGKTVGDKAVFQTKRDFSKTDYGHGNLYTVVGTGQQWLGHNVRGLACRGYTKDCDMESAYIYLLISKFKKVDIECPEIEYYAVNKSKVHEEHKIVKSDVLSMINDQVCHSTSTRSGNEFFQKIHDKIYNELIPIMEVKEKLLWKDISKRKKLPNKRGCFMATMLARDQGKLIDECKRLLLIEGYEVTTMICDGFLVAHEGNDTSKLEKDLKEVNDQVVELTGIEFKIRVKDMKVDKDYLELDFTSDTYDVLKKVYEEQEDLFKCRFPVPVYYWKDIIHTERNLIMQLKDTTFGPYVKGWLDDRDKKVYEKMDFLPTPMVCPESVKNIWKGYERSENPDIELCQWTIDIFHKYINHLVTEFNIQTDQQTTSPITAEFVIQMIAHMIQFPGIKIGLIFVICGVQGSGKGTFANLLNWLMGEYAITISDANHALGNFNDILCGKIVVFFDEAVSIDMFKKNDKLKNLSTEPTISVEEKGKPVKIVNNFSNIFITTNSDTPVKIEDENDRRIVVLKPEKIDKELSNDIYSKKFCKQSLFQYINNYKITINDWQAERPITNAYKEIRSINYPGEIRFIYDWLIDDNTFDKNPTSKGLFTLYKDFMDESGMKFPLTPAKFGIKMHGIKGCLKDKSNKLFDRETAINSIKTKFPEI